MTQGFGDINAIIQNAAARPDEAPGYGLSNYGTVPLSRL